MTTETLNPSEERQLDVSVGTIKRLKTMAMDRYNDAVRTGHRAGQDYHLGYMRALTHVLEAENE